MRLNVKSISLAAGTTAALLYAVCITAFAIAPSVIVKAGELIFHGISVQPRPVSAVDAVAGLIVAFVGAAVIAGVFATLNNKLLKK